MDTVNNNSISQFWGFVYLFLTIGINIAFIKATDIYEKIKNIDFGEFGVNVVLKYSALVNYITDKHAYAYENYNIVKVITDYSYFGYRKTKAVIFDYRIEPMRCDWISTSILIDRQNNNGEMSFPAYVESYDFMFGNELLGGDMNCVAKYRFEKSCETANMLVSSNSTNNILETMVIMKYNGKYVVRSFSKKNPKKDTVGGNMDLPLVITKNRFLSIEYTHPDMMNKIPLELSNDVFVVGNQILSPLYIRRMLEYQPEGYLFDMDYVLKIMDNDLKNIQMTGKDGGIII